MIDEQRRSAHTRDCFDFVVVEGVGGWLVPIRHDFLVSDLAAQMKLLVWLSRETGAAELTVEWRAALDFSATRL